MNNLDLFRHDFVLSIKPQYAVKIVEGLKKVELRRRFPYGTVTGARLYIYATVPVQAVIGYATIRVVERMPVEQIWHTYHDVAYISREDFEGYYHGVTCGYVLVLENAIRLKQPVTLAVLKSELKFTPPQSFTYADDDFRHLILGH